MRIAKRFVKCYMQDVHVSRETWLPLTLHRRLRAFPLRAQTLRLRVHLWTKTSEKALVKRRFSRTYPQAIPVIVGIQQCPQPLVPPGVDALRMRALWGGSMDGRL